MVSNLLRDVSVDEDSEAVRLMIQKKILPLAERYFEKYLPEMKESLINFIMERIHLPYMLSKEKKEIVNAIEEWLESSLVGYEDEDEMLSLAQTMVDEMANER